MANARVDRHFGGSGRQNNVLGTAGGAVSTGGTVVANLDASQGSWVSLWDAGSLIVVGLATPAGLTDDLRWVRGEMHCEMWQSPVYAQFGTRRIQVTVNGQPAYMMVNAATIDDWGENPVPSPAGTSRYIQGPRSLFLNGQWTAMNAYPTQAGETVYLNDLRFEIHDYLDPPTAAIVGPIGTTTIVGGAYVPAQWTFSSPHGFAYAGWRLQVATNADGTGVIYAASGTTETTHQIPAWALTDYVNTALYVRVSVAHGAPTNYLAPDPTTGYAQFGPFAQAQFTPVGAITVTFVAVRPAGWVDDLSTDARDLLTRSHTPVMEARLYQWDGQRSWPLDIVDGDVSFDATQQVRTTFSLTVTNAELRARQVYPMDPDRPLHPFGSYVQLARGVGDELIALCAGVIEEVSADVTVSGEAPVTVRGADWSRWFMDARLAYTRARQSWTGTAWVRDLVTTVLGDLVNEAGLTALVATDPGANRVAPNYVTARTAVRSELADTLCAELGWWWWADTLGRLVFEPLPAQTGTPRYRFVEGQDCIVLRHTAALARAEMYDLAVAYDDAGLYVGGAYDRNPRSPIVRGAALPSTPSVGSGPFSPGGKPFFFAGPLITSLAGAQSAARTVLARRAVPAERITIEIIPHPDLRAGHLIEVERVGEAPRLWIVAAGTIPLSNVRPMTVDAYSPVTYVQATN